MKKAYSEYRGAVIDSAQASHSPAAADPLMVMFYKSLSRNVHDSESMRSLDSLLSDSVGALDESDIIRRCRLLVGDRLKEKNLPLGVGQGQAVNLSKPGPRDPDLDIPSASNGASTSTNDDILLSDTAQTAASKVTEQRRKAQWRVSFGLTYHGIPLNRSSGILLLSGEDVNVGWRNMPRPEQLPPDSELEPNVSRDDAVAIGLDNLRRSLEKQGGDKSLDKNLKLESSKPSLTLWFPSIGIGRLVWTFSAVANVKEQGTVGRQFYHIEACKPVEVANTKPRILEHAPLPISHVFGMQSPESADSAAFNSTSSRLSYSH
jgi:hypothetical protein